MVSPSLQFLQIDNAVKALRERPIQRPRGGWLRAVRTALGMTSSQLAHLLQTSQSTVIGYEQREMAGTISLATLRRVASALDCDLVYVLLPRRPLGEFVESRAREVARRKLEAVAHSMRLEDQGVSDEAMERQVEELARKLIETRRRELWQ